MKRARRVTRFHATVLAGLVAFVAVVGIEANGATDVAKVDKVGWWSKRPAAAQTTTTGFEVASGPDGDESVAAVRVLVFGTVTKATLNLSEAANQLTAVSAPKLRACRTDSPWLLTTGPGPFDQAPKPNCSGGEVAFTRDAQGVWRADVSSWLTGSLSELSIMVVPAVDNTLPIPPTFLVQFATARVDAAGTPDVTTPPVQAAPPAPVAAGGGGVSTAPPRSTPAVTTGAPTTVPTPTTVAATTPETPTRLAVPVVSSHKPKQWGKLVWIVPLSALIAVGWVAGRKTLSDRHAAA
jgi:hypothetical protein